MKLTYPLKFGWYYKLLPGIAMRFRTTSRELCLSFDDGPCGKLTDFTLNELAKVSAPAIFFIEIDRALGDWERLRSLVQAGHQIGIHGWHHRSLLFHSSARVVGDYLDAQRRIEDRVGIRVNWLRPPYAIPPIRGWNSLRRAGFTPIYMRWMLGDFEQQIHPLRVAKEASQQFTDGDIIVMHDGGPAPQIFRAMLPVLLEETVSRGYRWSIPDNAQLM